MSNPAFAYDRDVHTGDKVAHKGEIWAIGAGTGSGIAG
jgi:hypothetical protein